MFNPAVCVGWLAAVGCVRPLLDEPAIKGLRRVVDGEKDSSFPLANWMRPPRRALGPKPLYVPRKVELVKRPHMHEVGILARHVVRVLIFARELVAAGPLSQPANRVLVPTFQDVFR